MSQDDALLGAVKNIIREWNETHFHLAEGTVTLDREDWVTLKDAILELDELVFEMGRVRDEPR